MNRERRTDETYEDYRADLRFKATIIKLMKRGEIVTPHPGSNRADRRASRSRVRSTLGGGNNKRIRTIGSYGEATRARRRAA